MERINKTIIVLVCFLILSSQTNFVSADTEGQNKVFFVDSHYDNTSREKVETVLQKVSQRAYFYVESGFSPENLEGLALEFDNVIYPKLTSAYGAEWKKGIDNDEKITIVFHKLKQGVAGYFRNEDEYQIQQAEKSNEREMVYLNIDYVSKPIAKSFLAHEFTHLITFNQKDRLKGLQEEIWLNEARADFSPFLLGYDEVFQGSNLQQRITEFMYSPSNSLTDWQNQKSDYGIISAFMQYLADQYGDKIISSSFEAKSVGFDSLSFALQKWGVEKSIEQIFTDFSVAAFLNDCQAGQEYCFQNQNLANFRIVSSLVYLSQDQLESISLDFTEKSWSARWFRLLAKDGGLKIILRGAVHFGLPYVLCDKLNVCKVGFLEPNTSNTAELYLPKFSDEFYSLTLIPSAQPAIKTLSEDNQEPSYNFNLSVSLENTKTNGELIEELLGKIETLKTQIADLQAQLALMQSQNNPCPVLEDLYLGKKNEQVECLQMFLKNQGKDIYPEGIISGFFGALTKKAVIRFQEKYKSDILTPFGLQGGNGYVGALTRAKISALLSQ